MNTILIGLMFLAINAQGAGHDAGGGSATAAQGAVERAFRFCRCHDVKCLRTQAMKDGEKGLDCLASLVGEFLPMFQPFYEVVKTAVDFDPENFAKAGQEVTLVARDAEAPQCLKDAAEGVQRTIDGAGAWSRALRKAANINSATLRDFVDVVDKSVDLLLKANDIQEQINDCAISKNFSGISAVTSFSRKLRDLVQRYLNPVATRSAALKRLPGWGTVYTCTTALSAGYRLFRDHGKCLAADVKALKDSQRLVAASMAMNETRMFNEAKYVGCRRCVVDNARGSALRDCRSCCTTEAAKEIPPAGHPVQNRFWNSFCRMSCTDAWTNGALWKYMDRKACRPALRLPHQKRFYRTLSLELGAEESGDRRTTVTDRRAQYLSALEGLGELLTAKGDGMTFDELKTAAETESDARRRSAAEVVVSRELVVRDVPYLFYLLDSASVGPKFKDGKITKEKIDHLKEELMQYRDDSELQ